MSWRPWFSSFAAVAAVSGAGCAQGDTDEGYDASQIVASRDGTAPRVDSTAPVGDSGSREASPAPLDAGSDRGVDTGPVQADTGVDVVMPGSDAGDAGCSAGSHVCGATCTPNGPNSPSSGCALACGSAPCLPPEGGTSTCSDAGTCGFECDVGFMQVGSGCSSGACSAQCCSDGDCAAAGFQNTTCTGGTCSGCQPNFGDCDGNPANGCEKSLDDYFNCGACSNKCDGSEFACGFFGGGQNCESNGTGGYACGC